MTKRITVDPITRLEGHGRIDIFLGDSGDVDRAYFRVPELRGFEKFAQGRPAEDMPQITSRICGVCPTAHHMASTKALDNLYKVEPPPAAKKIRELVYSMFFIEDHALHFFYLAGPDFIVGPDAPKAERNILGVLGKVGEEVGLRVIGTRKELRELMTLIAGKAVHPVFGLPGGVAKPVDPQLRARLEKAADSAVEFGQFCFKALADLVLSRKDYVDKITSDAYTHQTYYMGMVDEHNKVNFYDGQLHVVKPDGSEFSRFDGADYLDHIAEHVEPWTYMKFSFLKQVGWNGLSDGESSGILAVAPLARLNVAEGMATPLAQQAYEEFYRVLGGKPVHFTLATSWARVIELLYAAERMRELAVDDGTYDREVRVLPDQVPTEGIGAVEAPRGVLIHHYVTDKCGIIEKANLMVATQHNAGRIALSVDKAARNLINRGKYDDGILNQIEMAFRAYDPCHGCATHALPGQMPLLVSVYDSNQKLMQEIRRD